MKLFNYLTLFLSIFCGFLQLEATKPDFTLQIPMRDGFTLPTDIYLPTPEARGLPCILIRSPSGRQGYWKDFPEIAKAGYVVAIQSTRSSLDSEGKTLPFFSDGWGKLQDGYDTVEWLAQSPYTNGKIGTWGASALGITQLLMAPTAPPHLTCQYIIFAASSLYHHGLFPGGQFLKHQAESWLGLYAKDSGIISYVSNHPFYNEFWDQLNSLERPYRSKVPGMHVGGWYDTFLQGTLDAFSYRQYQGGEGSLGKQKLVIGPWTHFWPMSKKLGDFEVPKAGETPPVDVTAKTWFDFYLKGEKNGIDAIPNVTYYVMGPFDGSPSSGNVWKSSDVWPVPADPTPFYLNSNLKLEQTTCDNQSKTFVYDPSSPILTQGGRNLFQESGPKDQGEIEKRDDLLVFTTDVLKEDLEVTGPIFAELYFSSDKKDTDLFLRLCDVYPDGKSYLITEGGVRTGIINYGKELKNNQPNKIKIDLIATSIVFAKGHAIRLSVSSSNFPRIEKNMNVGLLDSNLGLYEVARNTIYFGDQYPSHISLPLVKKGEGDVYLETKGPSTSSNSH